MNNRQYDEEANWTTDGTAVPVCKILNVKIAAINMNWIIKFLEKNLKALSGDYICVANVHTTVMAYEDAEYLGIQNGGIMAIPDGGPLSYIGRKRGFERMERVTGPDLMSHIFEFSEKNKYRHFFYGSTEETLKEMNRNIKKEFPNLQIVGMYSPPFRLLTEDENQKMIDMINDLEPDFIWVGLGAPKQEKWMAEHKNKVKGLMIGVGAGFDYFAGNIKRAPKWMQNHNLEWLYRLIQDPRRLFHRYFYTNSKFLFNVIIKKK